MKTEITIGVLGNGFVGSAVANAFIETNNVKIFDKDPSKSNSTFEETIDQDIVFVCVPTPMKSADGADCNLNILENVFNDIENNNKRNDNVFVIKSTVPVGTTRRLQSEHFDLNILHSPEFLTAVNAKEDFINASRHVIGIPSRGSNQRKYQIVSKLFQSRFPNVLFLEMDSNESEFVKYACNCFLATKVAYFNEIKLLSDNMCLDWNEIMKGILSDTRIGKSHTSVPGPDGELGFGGTCFPKDINAFIKTLEKNNIDPLVMKAAWEQNKKVRKNWDWANNSSAVS